MTETPTERPWIPLADRIGKGDRAELEAFLNSLAPLETAQAIAHLDAHQRDALFNLLSPREAAAVIHDLPDVQAAEVLAAMEPEQAAPIVDKMASDDRADVLGGVSVQVADDILERMHPREASDARRLLSYPDDSAGGLMVTEFLSYSDDRTVGQILEDLRGNRDRYTRYDVQYVYCVSADRRLLGVLRLRDLVLASSQTPIGSVMQKTPVTVRATESLENLAGLFKEHPFVGLPVVDGEGRLLGVIRRSAVHEAAGEEAQKSFLEASGIVGGEELRSMPLRRRVVHRLSWLSVNILLNVIAASVIAMHQDTLSAVVVLAVFLPIISDMSGCSGNQAVAVSIRELSLGLLSKYDAMRVVAKECAVGFINGLVLGALLSVIAIAWKGNLWLGLVVGSALALNTLIAATFGGTIPVILKRFKLDPALASGPILTTVTDLCGFLLVLKFANLLLPRLTS